MKCYMMKIKDWDAHYQTTYPKRYWDLEVFIHINDIRETMSVSDWDNTLTITAPLAGSYEMDVKRKLLRNLVYKLELLRD